MKRFDAPKKTLGGLDAEAAATLIAAAADVALIVDADGIIRDVAFGSDELSREEEYGKWLGQPWVDTVTVESRPKVEALLRDAASNVPSKGRQVNHMSARGADVPVMYSAVQVGGKDRVVAVGRDLRAIAALQQRLVQAQQSMERDYWRMRQVETRYRMLFQMASEPVLVVDADNERIVEANPAVATLLGERSNAITGRQLGEWLEHDSLQPLTRLLSAVQATGRPQETRVRLAAGRRQIVVAASMVRQDKSSYFLVRLLAREADAAGAAVPKAASALLGIVEHAPDAIVVTDASGHIQSANGAFIELAQLANAEQVRGESLDRWLGRPGVDLNVLVANLREHGNVRLYATTLRGEHGSTAEVEISAVSVQEEGETALGFLIRGVGRRLASEKPIGQALPRSVEQLTELVGRVPLKDIVRETTDLIERLCIEAALELTRDNRASASEMLGLSRQSLYVKLRRYGLGDLAGDSED